jgi:hypothetical protein
MTKVVYDPSSPYYGTPQTNWYLGPISYREIPAHTSDMYIQLDAKYEYRPDMLSNDVYGTPKYWWTFMVRNIDIIRDPIWDLKAGTLMYIPTLERIQQIIG